MNGQDNQSNIKKVYPKPYKFNPKFKVNPQERKQRFLNNIQKLNNKPKAIQRSNSVDNIKKEEPPVIDIKKLEGNIMSSIDKAVDKALMKYTSKLNNLIEVKSKFYVDQKLSLIEGSDYSIRKGIDELTIANDPSNAGNSFQFKYNGEPVARITESGMLYCKNIWLNGVNLLSIINSLIMTDESIVSQYVKHKDLKNGRYEMDIKDIVTKTLEATTGTIETLNSNNITNNEKITTDELEANTGTITTLESTDLTTDTIASRQITNSENITTDTLTVSDNITNDIHVNPTEITNREQMTGKEYLIAGYDGTKQAGYVGINTLGHDEQGFIFMNEYDGVQTYGLVVDQLSNQSGFNNIPLTVNGQSQFNGNITSTADVSAVNLNASNSVNANVYYGNTANIPTINTTDLDTTNLVTYTITAKNPISGNPNDYVKLYGNLLMDGIRFKMLHGTLTTGNSMYRVIGKSENNGECAYEQFYDDDNTPSNRYLQLGIQGYNGLKIFNTKLQSSLTHYFDSGIDVSGLVSYLRNQQVYIYGSWLRMFNVGLTAGNDIHFYFGKDNDTDCHSLHMRYHYGNDSLNRYAGIGLNDADGYDYELIRIYEDSVSIDDLASAYITALYVDITQDINVTGDGWIGGNLDIDGHCGIDGNCMINGDLTVQGQTIYHDEIEVAGDADIQGNATVAGSVSCGSLTIDGTPIDEDHIAYTNVANTFTEIQTINKNTEFPLVVSHSTLSNGQWFKLKLTDGTENAVIGLGKDSTGYYNYIKLNGRSAQIQIYANETKISKPVTISSNLTITGTGTIPTLSSTTGTITTLNSTTGTITTLNSTTSNIGTLHITSALDYFTNGLTTGWMMGLQQDNNKCAVFSFDNQNFTYQQGIYGVAPDIIKYDKDQIWINKPISTGLTITGNTSITGILSLLSNYLSLIYSSLTAGNEVQFALGKGTNSYESAQLGYHLDSTLSNSYSYLTLSGMSGLKVYGDKVESVTPFYCPSIYINGSQLDFSNIAYKNIDNNFTVGQHITGALNVSSSVNTPYGNFTTKISTPLIDYMTNIKFYDDQLMCIDFKKFTGLYNDLGRIIYEVSGTYNNTLCIDMNKSHKVMVRIYSDGGGTGNTDYFTTLKHEITLLDGDGKTTLKDVNAINGAFSTSLTVNSSNVLTMANVLNSNPSTINDTYNKIIGTDGSGNLYIGNSITFTNGFTVQPTITTDSSFNMNCPIYMSDARTRTSDVVMFTGYSPGITSGKTIGIRIGESSGKFAEMKYRYNTTENQQALFFSFRAKSILQFYHNGGDLYGMLYGRLTVDGNCSVNGTTNSTMLETTTSVPDSAIGPNLQEAIKTLTKDVEHITPKITETETNYTNSFRAIPTKNSFGKTTAYSPELKLFVNLGYNTGRGYYSYDGVSWIEMNIPSVPFQSVVWGDAGFVAICYGNRDTYTSLDGINWTQHSNVLISLSSYFWKIVFGNDIYVVICDSNTEFCQLSLDGVDWNQMYGGHTSATWRDMWYSPEQHRWVVVGERFYWSTCTQFGNWTGGQLTPTTYSFYSVTYGKKGWIAVGQTYYYKSTDGSNWTQGTLPSTGIGNYAIYTLGRYFIIPAQNQTVPLVTYDLTNFQSLKAFNYGYHYEPAFGNGVVVAPEMSENVCDVYNPANAFNNTRTILESVYPIGAVYTSFRNVSPDKLFGFGTWTSIFTGYERQCIGSQVLYSQVIGTGTQTKVSLLGAYSYRLIQGVFTNITIPTGYHREYRLTFQGSTGGSPHVQVFLNNIGTNDIGTWSSDTFRDIGASNYFKESDITLETTMGYSNPGINLKYSNSGNSDYRIYNITIHGFIVSDTQTYKWKRTA